MSGKRSGGEVLVDQLVAQGVTDAFCVPGESYLDVLNALYLRKDNINLYVARQDGGGGQFQGRCGQDQYSSASGHVSGT